MVTDRLVIQDREETLYLPDDLRVRHLEIARCAGLRGLPPDLFAENVRILDCPRFATMPSNVWIRNLEIDGCEGIETLSNGLRLETVSMIHCPSLKGLAGSLRFRNLKMPGSRLETLSMDLVVRETLDLRNSKNLVSLPAGLHVGQELILRDCTALAHLPDGLNVDVLDLSGCTGLQFHDMAHIETRHLDISDCVQLTELPECLWVWDSIDVANTGLKGLPPFLSHCQILWRGVPIQERIAFDPDSLNVAEILGAQNMEQRRVMLERVGWEAFLDHVLKIVHDLDRDPGGERKLLGFSFANEEQVRVLSVCCPSTGRRYCIRVPPWIRSCREAAAWIAGFDNAEEYEPVLET